MGDCTLQEIIDAIALANGFDNLTQDQCDLLKLGFQEGKLSPYVLNFYLWATLGGKFPSGSTCTVKEIFDAIALEYGFNSLTTAQCDKLKAGYTCGAINAEIMNFLFWSAVTSLKCPDNVPLLDANAGDVAQGDYLRCTALGGDTNNTALRRVDAPSGAVDVTTITVTKDVQQAQIWDSPPTASNPTAIVTPAFAALAPQLFDFDANQNNSFIMKPGQGGTFAGLMRYTGSGWDGGSTGTSGFYITANAAPILTSPVQKVSASLGPQGTIATNFQNFPTGGAVETGSWFNQSIPDGYFVQFWTNYAGNDGGGSNNQGNISNIPNNLELMEAIFIKTGP